MPRCFVCKKNYESVSAIYIHFKALHHLHALSTFRCGEYSCSRVFHNIKSFQRHWLLTHSAENTSVNRSLVTELKGTEDSENLTISINNGHTTNSIRNNQNPVEKRQDPYSPNNFSESMQNNALQLATHLYNLPTLPRSHARNIINRFSSLLKSHTAILQCAIAEKLKNCGACHNETSADILNYCSAFSKSFQALETEHLYLKALEKNENIIKFVPYVVGQKFQRIAPTPDGHTRMGLREVKAYYFPLKLLLKKIFEIPNVYDETITYMQNLQANSEIISNFIQGYLWKKIISESRGKMIIPLFLFCDDFEKGNALGSHAGVNKLGGVYISIPCLPEKYRSSLSSIFTALLFYANDRKNFGNAAVFNILIKQLHSLETNGVEIVLPEGKRTIYFKLGLILGDNLGLHSMLGFVENFNANYSCRFCKMNKEQRAKCCIEIDSTLRNKDNYLQDVEMCDVSLTGIKEECVFNKLVDFHVVDNQSVDIMHDIFEGVCNFDMVQILKYYIENIGLFSLQDLNSLIQSHDYGPIDIRNMPPAINANYSKTESIKMSAAEMWTFVRHFALLVGDIIPENDQVWEFYLTLQGIVSLVTSPSMQTECCVLLASMIQEHNTMYQKLFKKHLKPKAHFLVHYSRILKSCGPLVHLWSMRFESKHRELKNSVSTSSCNKNILSSIAFKVQLKLAESLLSKNILDTKDIEIGPGDHATLKELQINFSKKIDLMTKMYFVKWIKSFGTRYKQGMAVCIGDKDNTPVFAKIQYIGVTKKRIYFICNELDVRYTEHYNAYEVMGMNDCSEIIDKEELISFIPNHLIKKNSGHFILLRNML